MRAYRNPAATPARQRNGNQAAQLDKAVERNLREFGFSVEK
jgi:hypothetical protein